MKLDRHKDFKERVFSRQVSFYKYNETLYFYYCFDQKFIESEVGRFPNYCCAYD